MLSCPFVTWLLTPRHIGATVASPTVGVRPRMSLVGNRQEAISRLSVAQLIDVTAC
jgi:hypothetical protein